jgi:hypothetical protein
MAQLLYLRVDLFLTTCKNGKFPFSIRVFTHFLCSHFIQNCIVYKPSYFVFLFKNLLITTYCLIKTCFPFTKVLFCPHHFYFSFELAFQLWHFIPRCRHNKRKPTHLMRYFFFRPKPPTKSSNSVFCSLFTSVC